MPANPDPILLTPAGAKRLAAQLRQLKAVDRPQVVAAIAEARAHGDLSENAEYAAAKEQQRFIEKRIGELEVGLGNAKIVRAAAGGDGKVVFGVYVDLYDAQTDAEITYQLVGNLEADLAAGRISIQSPIGRALLGKHIGDEVEVNAPAGKRVYEILAVRRTAE